MMINDVGGFDNFDEDNEDGFNAENDNGEDDDE